MLWFYPHVNFNVKKIIQIGQILTNELNNEK